MKMRMLFPKTWSVTTQGLRNVWQFFIFHIIKTQVFINIDPPPKKKQNKTKKLHLFDLLTHSCW